MREHMLHNFAAYMHVTMHGKMQWRSLTPAGDNLKNAKLEASNGPESQVGAATIPSHRLKSGNLRQLVIHFANVAYFGAGGVGDKHDNQQHNEDDHCRAPQLVVRALEGRPCSFKDLQLLVQI